MDFAKYFQRDPRICGGATVITCTRITLRTVLASLAEGSAFDEILKDYPSLLRADCRITTQARAGGPSRVDPGYWFGKVVL